MIVLIIAKSPQIAFPITLFDFAIEIVGKPGPIVVDINTYGIDTEDIIITGNPITLQDVHKAFIGLNVNLTEGFSRDTKPCSFNFIRFDKERNKYTIFWNYLEW